MTLPQWKAREFGCVLRDSYSIDSLMRTQVSASMPAPFVSRSADASAPIVLRFSIDLDKAGLAVWEQWYTFDLHEGTLPFTMFLPWGDAQPQVRCRLLNAWRGQRMNSVRWMISGHLQIEREGLPAWSGGAR